MEMRLKRGVALFLSMVLTLLSHSTAEAQPYMGGPGAKLEIPAGRILHGWGRFSIAWDKGARDGGGDEADLAAYARSMEPCAPAILSFYTGLDSSLMADFAERYKALAARRGPFVAQIAVGFQSHQQDTSQGMRDPEIVMMMDTIREAGKPALLRIGYDFNGPAAYDPSPFIQSFRRIVDRMREARLDRAATVWNATASGLDGQNFMRWYPGDDVVDWWGIDLFDIADFDSRPVAEFLAKARSHGKPVIVCEASPVFRTPSPGRPRGPQSAAEANQWYEKLVALLGAHQEIQAIALFSVDWRRDRETPPGAGWPDARIERWPSAVTIWKKAMCDRRTINAGDLHVALHVP